MFHDHNELFGGWEEFSSPPAHFNLEPLLDEPNFYHTESIIGSPSRAAEENLQAFGEYDGNEWEVSEQQQIPGNAPWDALHQDLTLSPRWTGYEGGIEEDSPWVAAQEMTQEEVQSDAPRNTQQYGHYDAQEIPIQVPQWDAREQVSNLDAPQNAQQGGAQGEAPLPVLQDATRQEAHWDEQDIAQQDCARTEVPLNAQLPLTFSQMKHLRRFGDLDYITYYDSLLNPHLPQRAFSLASTSTTCSIDIELKNSSEWTKLHEQTNEMMITNQGRSLFPHIGFNFGHLNPDSEYILAVHLAPQSEHQYAYRRVASKKFQWVKAKLSKKPEMSNTIFSVPLTGATLIKRGFVFRELKVFNIGSQQKKEQKTKAMDTGKIEERYLAQERHMLKIETRSKYQPVVTVYEVGASSGEESAQLTAIGSATFPNTLFVASTGYKNKLIKTMKATSNKYVRKDTKKKHGAMKSSVAKSIRKHIPLITPLNGHWLTITSTSAPPSDCSQ